MTLALCADVGSTYTKVAVVDLDGGALVGSVERPTTAATDVLHGLDAAAAALPAVPPSRWYVCSSAGGGLRLAVVGYEALVTAEAGHRVGLSAGARVVHVSAGPLAGLAALRAARPDVVLLVGGTDGGDAEVLTHNARRLARARWRVPVVLAGNADVRDSLAAELAAAGVPVTAAANVLPRIGVLEPVPARAAIRDVFLRHVIGGKRLSRGRRFAGLVRAATPDAVLAGVEALADHAGGSLLVVDVGGATTDVYSVVTLDGPSPDVAGTLRAARTVEGDLGMRWTAPGVIAAAQAERLLPADRPDHGGWSVPGAGSGSGGHGSGGAAGGDTDMGRLAAAAAARAADPGLVPDSDEERVLDRRIAALAATVAVRRHARGRDLRDARLVVGSGGVLRHAPAGDAKHVLDAVLADHAGGWAVPRAASAVVDVSYVLGAAGLLAGEHPAAARALLDRHLLG